MPHYALVLQRRIAVLRTYMRPIVTDLVAWSVGLSVGLSVCRSSAPCKNVRSDRDAVCAEDSVGAQGNVGHEVQMPPWEGAILVKGRPL